MPRHRVERLGEGGEGVGRPCRLLDVVEADDADILRDAQAELVARATSMKPQAMRSLMQKTASGGVSPVNSARAASAPVS